MGGTFFELLHVLWCLILKWQLTENWNLVWNNFFLKLQIVLHYLSSQYYVDKIFAILILFFEPLFLILAFLRVFFLSTESWNFMIMYFSVRSHLVYRHSVCFFNLDQHCSIEFSMIIELFYVCTNTVDTS